MGGEKERSFGGRGCHCVDQLGSQAMGTLTGKYIQLSNDVAGCGDLFLFRMQHVKWKGVRDGLVLVGLEAKGPEVYIYRRLLGALPLVLCARMRNAGHASQREATSRQLCVMQGQLGMLVMRSNHVAGRDRERETHTHTHTVKQSVAVP